MNNNTPVKKEIIKVCPECYSLNCEKYDEIHDEVFCRVCGLVLEAPPTPGIIFPGLLIIIKKTPILQK